MRNFKNSSMRKNYRFKVCSPMHREMVVVNIFLHNTSCCCWFPFLRKNISMQKGRWSFMFDSASNLWRVLFTTSRRRAFNQTNFYGFAVASNAPCSGIWIRGWYLFHCLAGCIPGFKSFHLYTSRYKQFLWIKFFTDIIMLLLSLCFYAC